MGYSIFLKGDSFDHDGWVSDLGGCGMQISDLGAQISNLLAQNRAADQEEEMWLHPRGGLRGVTVKRTNGGAELSLPAGFTA